MTWYWWLLAAWLSAGGVSILGFVLLNRRPTPWPAEPPLPREQWTRRECVTWGSVAVALAFVVGPFGTYSMILRWGNRLCAEDNYRTGRRDY